MDVTYAYVGRAAQRYMINRALEWTGVEEGANAPKTGVDIGKSFSDPKTECVRHL